MVFDPQKLRRRSIRLPGYDYTQSGAYFVTVCTHLRECLFGEIVGNEMVMNPLGKVVLRTWEGLPRHYPHVALDAFCVMPNHVHGIVILIDDDCKNGIRSYKRHGLPEVVRAFKSYSARRINRLRQMVEFPVWQRNYYEHIVRGEREWDAIRWYILDNPLNWESNLDHPG